MKAAVYHGRRDVRVEDMPLPSPGEGELLVQVTGVGICGTDATEFAVGPTMFPVSAPHPVTHHVGPLIPGHEFAGVVAGTGRGVVGFAEGDALTSGAGVSCGQCRYCTAGRNNLCDTYATVGLQRHGALAEFVTVPAASCVNLAGRSLSSDVAAMAQPMSIAVHAMRRGRPQPGESAVVLGAGGIGVFLVHALTSLGVEVTAVDLDPARLAVARRAGAVSAVAATTDRPLLEQLTDTARTDLVYECTGVPAGVDAAIGHVNRGGRVVVVGLHKAPVAVHLTNVALQEKELIGTLAHVFGADFLTAVELLEHHGDLWRDVAPTVLPLDDLVTNGLGPMVDGGHSPIKTLLDPRLDTERAVEVGDRAVWS